MLRSFSDPEGWVSGPSPDDEPDEDDGLTPREHRALAREDGPNGGDGDDD